MPAGWGGDEFGVLLRGCEIGRALVIGETVRKAVQSTVVHWEGRSLSVGASLRVESCRPLRRTRPPNAVNKLDDLACWPTKATTPS